MPLTPTSSCLLRQGTPEKESNPGPNPSPNQYPTPRSAKYLKELDRIPDSWAGFNPSAGKSGTNAPMHTIYCSQCSKLRNISHFIHKNMQNESHLFLRIRRRATDVVEVRFLIAAVGVCYSGSRIGCYTHWKEN